MADGKVGLPPDILNPSPKDLRIKPLFESSFRSGVGNPSLRLPEFGRVDLSETPYGTDVKAVQSQFFPEGEHLKIANGSEYILDPTGKTIILFEKPTDRGFTAVYSPLTPQELREKISRLPTEQQEQLAQLLHLPERDTPSFTIKSTQGVIVSDLLRSPQIASTGSINARSVESDNATRHDLSPTDLPENHFLPLTDEAARTRKTDQWEAVKDLPEDNMKKILYYRRFPEEFHSAPLSPELTRQLRGTLRYYGVDSSKMSELVAIEPYLPTIEVPPGRKIGFIIGYHHLEKAWSHIFMERMRAQAQFQPEQIEFILVQNRDIPTGDPSPASEKEIREIVASRGITDVIDIHEQFSTLNHYMDYDSAADFKETFKKGYRKNPHGGEYTLDPTVPLWAIEQYYEGNIYPQLQYAVNEQIKKAEILIRSLQK